MASQPSAGIRLYKDRVSYSLRTASTSFVKERSPMSPSCTQGMKKGGHEAAQRDNNEDFRLSPCWNAKGRTRMIRTVMWYTFTPINTLDW
ncbi:hypothetical protein I315_00033 [Cryptococcus gattii Ru294]|nr:hypothetical protein I315_00033 [Cryptococcus gattii Ru294]